MGEFFSFNQMNSVQIAKSFIIGGMILGVMSYFFEFKFDIFFIIAVFFFIVGHIILYKHVKIYGFRRAYKKEELKYFLFYLILGSFVIFMYIFWKFNLVDKTQW